MMLGSGIHLPLLPGPSHAGMTATRNVVASPGSHRGKRRASSLPPDMSGECPALPLSVSLRVTNELHEVVRRQPVPVDPVVVVAVDARALAEIVPRREHEQLRVLR